MNHTTILEELYLTEASPELDEAVGRIINRVMNQKRQLRLLNRKIIEQQHTINSLRQRNRDLVNKLASPLVSQREDLNAMVEEAYELAGGRYV